ncbi:MAG: gliding motility-associated C-terminal domain-containing protein, partial [Prevotellaceae bacterium]|nr:gliding motility-associated C-terminal domain-containing protein [Prevotellaceae bacterium]
EVTGKLADSKNTGNFLVDAADLDGAIGAEMTAIPQCDASRAKTEKISIQIFNAIQIDELIANGTSYTDPEAEIKEEIRIGEELSIIVNPLTFDPAQHLFFINNDLWTAGNVYVDYPVNDKTYKVVLTDTDRVCSDTKTVRVKVAALPTAVLSSESANYSQYVANNLEKGTFVSVVGNLTIFNRYGQEVFSESSNDPTTPVFWAGQDKDDEQLAPGTYFYVYTTPVGQVQRGTFEVVK